MNKIPRLTKPEASVDEQKKLAQLRAREVQAGTLLCKEMDKDVTSQEHWLGKLSALLVREDNRARLGLRWVAKAGSAT